MIAIVNWEYVILRWPSGGVYRVKRRTDGPPPVPESGADLVNDDAWSKTAPPTRQYNGDQYDFAFWSITAQDMLSPQRAPFVESGRHVNLSHPGAANLGGGSWMVTAKAYYVRDVGLGGGNNGVFIDAFDVQAGDFLPDDFVDVNPDDQNKTLTASANDGYIDTDAQIAAGGSIKITTRDLLPSSKKFDYWQEVPLLLFSSNPQMPATVGAPDVHDIVANFDDIVYAFAFYNEVAPKLRIPFYHYEIYDPWWWIKTHGGLTPPHIGPEPWMKQFPAISALSEAAGLVSPKLRRSVLELVLQELSIISETIKDEIKNTGK